MSCPIVYSGDSNYVTGFGEGGFGEGTFGGVDEQGNIIAAKEWWDNDALHFEDGQDYYEFFQVLVKQCDRIDDEICNLYENRFVEQASGKELEELGKFVNCTRKTNEPDERYRIRINAEFAKVSSTTTYESFARLALNVLQTNADNVEIYRSDDDAPVVVVDTYQQVIQGSTFTGNEIGELLNDAVPAGHGVDVQLKGSFEFKSDTYTPPSGTGFSSDTVEGGTFGKTFSE